LAFIVIENGPLAGRRFQLRGTLTVGRQAKCDIRLSDRQVSRRHAAFVCVGQRIELVDLGSRNGTIVNGRRVQRCFIQFGAVIRAGGTCLRLTEKESSSFVGRTLGGYEVLEVVGWGGMGTVYRARQVSMDRVVALKVLRRQLAQDPAFVEQFVREARAAGKLDHRNIIHVHDVKREEDTCFFSMEFVDGVEVSTLLQEGPLPPLQAATVTLAVAEALAYAHEQGIVHGDVKPQNIMISKDSVKLADLGLARSMSRTDSLHEQEAGRVWGTPKYMAPEVARGGPPQASSDIYSLGATLYHMLTGRAPFSGRDAREILKKHMHEAPPPVRQLTPGVPLALARVAERMLAKDPAARPHTMREAIDDLAEARAATELELRGGRAPAEAPTAAVEPFDPCEETSSPTTGRRCAWRVVVVVVALAVAAVIAVVAAIGLRVGWFSR